MSKIHGSFIVFSADEVIDMHLHNYFFHPENPKQASTHNNDTALILSAFSPISDDFSLFRRIFVRHLHLLCTFPSFSIKNASFQKIPICFVLFL